MIEVDPLLAPRHILVLLALGGCGKVVDQTIPSGVKGSIEAGFLVQEVSPSAVKAGETLTLTGVGLDTVRITIGGGQAEVLSRDADRVVKVRVPDGKPGVQKIEVSRDGEVSSFLFLRLAEGDAAVVAGHIDTICQGEAYYDIDGNKWEGKRDCSTAALPEPCTEDGQVGCLTTETLRAASTAELESKIVQGAVVAGVTGTVAPAPVACETDGQVDCVANEKFRAADMAAFTDADIREGVSIAGISGILTGTPASCSSDGEIGCLTHSTYRAALTTGLADKILSGQTVAGVPGNVTLPGQGKVLTGTSYGVGGTSLTGSLTLPLESHVLQTAPVYGDPDSPKVPALVNRGTWNLMSSFPGAGYYAGITPPDASKILDGTTIAGVAGNVRLPPIGKVLIGEQYGANGTGMTGVLTLPNPANVLAGSGNYGDPNAQMVPALANKGTWNLANAFPGQGYYQGVDGVPGSGDIRDGVTLIGVAGAVTPAPGACSGEGQTGCVATATYPTVDTATVANRVVEGQNVAGVSGNVRLPPIGKVLSGEKYGVNGTSQTGALTLPDPANVLAGSGNYGDPGDQKVPALADKGTWNLASAFPGAGYYASVTGVPDPGDLRSGVTLIGVSGSIPPAPINCTGEGQSGCVATATYLTVDTATVADRVVEGQNVAGVPGNVRLPPIGKVLAGEKYGVNGTSQTGALTLPDPANVLAGTDDYGDPTDQKVPALANRGTWHLANAFPGKGYYEGVTGEPGSGDLRSGVTLIGVSGSLAPRPADCSAEGQSGCVATTTYKTVDTGTVADRVVEGATVAGVSGKVRLPDAGTVLDGVQFGLNGTVAGQLTLPDPGDVNQGVTYGPPGLGQLTGALILPEEADVLSTAGPYGNPVSPKTPTLMDRGIWDLRLGFGGPGYYSGVNNLPTPAQVKRGETILGVTGNFPSAASPLPRYVDDGTTTNVSGAPSYPDLENFVTDLTKEGAFGFWTSTGVWKTGSGDQDLVAENVRHNVVLENLGITGTWGPPPEPWNVRYGVSVNDVTGKLKVNCRNMAQLSYFNGNSPPPYTTGADPYETVDDGARAGTHVPTDNPWGSDEYLCGYDSVQAAEERTWKDVTQGKELPVYLDLITGLRWTRLDGPGRSWASAVNECDDLARNGTDAWRLPTQKELLTAYAHGIVDLDGLSVDEDKYFWSSTLWGTAPGAPPAPADPNEVARAVKLRIGNAGGELVTASHQVLCVAN